MMIHSGRCNSHVEIGSNNHFGCCDPAADLTTLTFGHASHVRVARKYLACSRTTLSEMTIDHDRVLGLEC